MSPRRTGGAFRAFLVVAFAVGAALRLFQLDQQIPADDEWHALHAVERLDALAILTSFGDSDHCIPLALFYEAVAGTLGLDELWMRAPMVLAALVGLIVMPAWVARRLGPGVGARFAWLLAIAPLAVYFARWARPYGPVFVLALVGAGAFYDAWTRGGRRGFVVHALCATLGAWASPVMAPFLFGPYAWAALERLRGRAEDGRWRAARAHGLAVLVGLAVLLGPPVLADLGAVTGKGGAGELRWTSLAAGTGLFLGSGVGWVGFALGLAALWGAFELRRAEPRLFSLFATLALLQVLAVVVARPRGLEHGIVLARYLLPLHGVVLVAAAVGLARIDAFLGRELRWLPPATASVAIGVGALALGPLLSLHHAEGRVYSARPNAFTNHALHQYFYDRRDRRQYAASTIRPERISRAYAKMRRASEPHERIVEAPWIPSWNWQNLVLYQRLHRREVVAGMTLRHEDPPRFGDLVLPDSRFRFRTLAPVADLSRLGDRARFLVLHKDLGRELGGPLGALEKPVGEWLVVCQGAFGEAFFEDETVVVYDLAPGR